MVEEVRRPRHLMDPSAPRRPAEPADLERLRRVQRWIVSVLTVTTVGHLAAGLIIGALVVDPSHLGARLALVALGTVCAVLGIVAARAIHGRPMVSAWPLLGLIPGAVAVALILQG